jgi:hypothetical protein
MKKINKLIYDLETKINNRPSKYIIGLIIFCVILIIL